MIVSPAISHGRFRLFFKVADFVRSTVLCLFELPNPCDRQRLCRFRQVFQFRGFDVNTSYVNITYATEWRTPHGSGDFFTICSCARWRKRLINPRHTVAVRVNALGSPQKTCALVVTRQPTISSLFWYFSYGQGQGHRRTIYESNKTLPSRLCLRYIFVTSRFNSGVTRAQKLLSFLFSFFISFSLFSPSFLAPYDRRAKTDLLCTRWQCSDRRCYDSKNNNNDI